ITQRNCHKENARAFVELLKREGVRERFILLLGGPRIDRKLAIELGFDAGFGPGTTPGDVASFIVERLVPKTQGSPVLRRATIPRRPSGSGPRASGRRGALPSGTFRIGEIKATRARTHGSERHARHVEASPLK